MSAIFFLAWCHFKEKLCKNVNKVKAVGILIKKEEKKNLLVNSYICLTGQDYEMFPINITWDFFPQLFFFLNIFLNLP